MDKKSGRRSKRLDLKCRPDARACLPLFSQLQTFVAHSGFSPEQTVLLRPKADELADAQLLSPQGIHLNDRRSLVGPKCNLDAAGRADSMNPFDGSFEVVFT
jgi:hypothetical protein